MSTKDKILFGMLIFVPIAIVSEWLKLSPILVFVFSALGIVPLAAFIAEATEEIAEVIGATLGGLLNATFGNLTEMVVSIVALRAGLVEVVQASILGAIIANLLLGLGLAMVLGGLRFGTQNFEPEVARLNGSSLLLAILVMLTPSAIHYTSVGLPLLPIQEFSYVASILLLICYGLSIIYSLKPSQDVKKIKEIEPENHQEGSDHAEEKKSPLGKPIIILLVCTLALVVVSEILVGSLEETVKVLGLTELFTGIILLPLFGGVVEYLTCVSAARKNQMDLSVAVAIGSTLQVVLFVTPVLILVSLFFPSTLTLEFNVFGIFSVVAAILITNSISSDGQSNWLEGAFLLILYAILGVAFYLHP
ncbi:calcium/proton exchanger [Gloeothece verrucosa]|uniref:Ca(2+)/H(+) antiporter n=1 Tax=Gloeothece verrucosa (strain PCC 7822) TaxID=497965 RepID=E0UID0_GLOV7|nr:calcium/proton exchanger [Gloeothece verrucosa]ADN16898.1 calcium/proton antiporter, CaCA family [Gloeothece verrucosa PCC 7822]